ncbi:unnamed protein product [Phaedon cochleariae]|uniref:Nucleolar 27S pre-rRNA processing Urb2/Npa2 C-terminal domain-containing protein n=1 Tax=Phaedon cochleariae TaxID=80249 RepID=A0A9P0GWI4_PHACE|nr:unnamed protein product [Phaedon cochleariae]
MSVSIELLHILNNAQEPIDRRIRIADNAFNSSELPPQCKALLLKWILKNDEIGTDTWTILNGWVNSDYFKELSRNEIDNKEIQKLVQLLEKNIISLDSPDNELMDVIFNTIILIFDNRIFQQYFKNEVASFCCLLNNILIKIHCSLVLLKCLKSNLFYQRNIIVCDNFCANFLQIILPTFIKILEEFKDDEVFLQISRTVQKCVFYNNHRHFGNFINTFFDGTVHEDHPTSKALFQYLPNILEDNPYPGVHFKLLFHSFSSSYDNDFELIYKFLIILLYLIGFDMNKKIVFHQFEALDTYKSSVFIEKPQDVVLGLLEVLGETKYDLSCNVNTITLTTYLNMLLSSHIFRNKPSSISCLIISKIIKIDPLIVQALTEQIIVYSIMADIEDHKTEYEELVILMFSIYSKLHRIENLVSKIVGTLNGLVNDGTIWEKEEYSFVKKEQLELITVNIFTENILSTFSQCIRSLASWQVINIFKTLLFSLKRALEAVQNSQESNSILCINIHILSELTGTFLSSIRVAEHTVTSTVVEKTEKCLQDLEDLLKKFATNVLNKEHNHVMMRSFLKISFYWAEMKMLLKYYSSDEDKSIGTPDNNFALCNLTFLHPYLTIKQWCLISERINNFGEPSCKQLLYKMYIQRLRALHLFTGGVNDNIISNLLKNINTDLDYCWKYILEDKFLLTILLPRMEASSVILLTEKMIDDKNTLKEFQRNQHLSDFSIILNAIVFVGIKRINKLVSKRKRKHNEEIIMNRSSTSICDAFDENIILCGDNQNSIEKAMRIHNETCENRKEIHEEIKINEEKLLNLFEILVTYPIIFCSEDIQRMFLLYLLSLYKDFSVHFSRGDYTLLQVRLENIIIGILQHCKFKLADIFKMEIVASVILDTFMNWEEAVSNLIENMLKQKDFLTSCEALTLEVTQKLYDPSYMECSIIILNALNKLKKSKLPKETKITGENMKNNICDKISKLVSEETPNVTLLAGYAYIMKNYLSQNDDEKITELSNTLDSYLNLILTNRNCYDKFGCLSLLITVLQNKSKLKNIDDDFPLKIWNAFKEDDSVYSRFEEYSQLILLIVGHIPNDQFQVFMSDLLNISDKLIAQQDFVTFGKNLKTWESVVTTNLNSTKTKVLQESLEELLTKIMNILESSENNEALFENTTNLQKSIIKANQLHLTPPMIDILILNSTILLDRLGLDFQFTSNLSISMLSSLLKYRKPLIMDRLPPYLQQYRRILRMLCSQSNSDANADERGVRRVADCAHQLEKLTKSLVLCQKDMGRIAMYLIVDILEQYEQITLYPNVKIHLNNCIYSLISICDQHAVSYLMRVLSTASTEIFKMLYENYKKYYRFTGKV